MNGTVWHSTLTSDLTLISSSPGCRRRSGRKHRGKLKIFLGYAAGVGKTYEMLKAAHLRKEEGIDVKVGIYRDPWQA